MDITFTCSGCGQHLVIDEAAAGITIDCPKCGKPAYVPSQSPSVTSPPTPMRIEVKSAKPYYTSLSSVPLPSETSPSPISKGEEDSIHPAIMGSFHCLIILLALGCITVIALRQNIFVGMAVLYMTIPFLTAQPLCAIYGICKGQVKHGLLLLAGLSLLIGLSNWITYKTMLGMAAGINADFQHQMEEMQKQMFKFHR